MKSLILLCHLILFTSVAFPCISNVSITQSDYNFVRLDWEDGCPPGTELRFDVSHVPPFNQAYFLWTAASFEFIEYPGIYVNSINRLTIMDRFGPINSEFFIATFTALAAPPARLNSPPIARVESNSISLIWGSKYKSAGPFTYNPVGTLYEVYLSTSPSFSSPLLNTLISDIATPSEWDPYKMTIGCLAPDTNYYAQVRAINRAGVPTEFVSLGSTKTLPSSVPPTTYSWAGAQWGMSIQSNELAEGDSVLFNETPTTTPLLSSTLPEKIVAANNKLNIGGDGRRVPLYNGPAEILKRRGCPAQLVSEFEQITHLNFNFTSNSGWVEGKSGRVREDTLSFYQLDDDLGVWNKIPSQVKNGQVTATVKELGTLAVMGQEDVSLQDLRVSPNPFHQGTDTHITFANLSERATVKIFTPAGREVCRLEESDGDGLLLWDGRNSSGDAVEPGVYVYHVESPGSERQGKVMVLQ